MKSSHQYIASFFNLISLLLLSACGGGGGGTTETASGGTTATASGGTIAMVSSSVISAPLLTETASSVAFELGVRSTATGATGYGSANQVAILAVNAPGVTSSAASARNVQILSNAHISDTGAAIQWADGWTGLGSTISVIDNFEISESSQLFLVAGLPFTVSQMVNGESYHITYRSVFAESLSHGDVTSRIAGGGGVLPSAEPTSVFLEALSSTCAQTSCTGLSLTALDALDVRDFSINLNRFGGVAKEAEIIHRRLPELRENLILSALQESFGNSAVNLSIGNPLPNGSTLADLRSDTAFDIFNGQVVNAVIVIGAGNGGALCLESNLSGCNELASELALYPSTANNVIIAGATSGSGTTEAIASFSNRAGILKERFLLAPGGTGLIDLRSASGREEIVGTSFSAPRIVGAVALLRQKFPNLSGSDVASVLLLSANKDINNDGTPDFSGVSDIYGHGKLSLHSAMSPVGNLVTR